MVIPWIGIPLADVIRRFEPASNTRFVYFETLYDRQQMPGQNSGILDWPYCVANVNPNVDHPRWS